MSREQFNPFDPFSYICYPLRVWIDYLERAKRLFDGHSPSSQKPRVLMVCLPDTGCPRYGRHFNSVFNNDDWNEFTFERISPEALHWVDITAECARIASGEFIEVMIQGTQMTESALRLIETARRCEVPVIDCSVKRQSANLTESEKGHHLRVVAGKL